MTAARPVPLPEGLRLRYPIVQGPFGGGLSTVALAAAVADAGGLGGYGAHILTPDDITATVKALHAATDGPFAVNLWVPQEGEETRPSAAETARHLERLRPYYRELGIPEPDLGPESGPPVPGFAEQLDALLAASPPAVSFVMGVPPREAVDRARRQGTVVIGTATTVAEAEALEAGGVDVVVASGADAGGHRGAFLRPLRESLVGTLALVPQVVDAVSLPVIAAGGIGDGRGVAAALTLGASAVQIGTGFLATDEGGAAAAHRRLLGTPEARSTVLTRLFSGRHARGIPNRVVRELADAEDAVPAYPVQSELMQPLRRAAAERGRPELMSLWAGQAAALATGGGAAAYLDRLVREAGEALGRPL
ncbi:nitronate monooxygenase family protein [Streptomyces sp. JJ38]|uniref:NAD(P)H-dependent flavin oxidoreductase n=1 Tax=Streptomyces sp. JJ38 TaxID=2738128 RepID=UPI001C570770|nr:DUF561 domain-containing protein [Streptomyces sp. JJ38]MBW1596970.1 DUF561 domain-containing protein [Streptomyces sp. JJ38]